MLFLYPAIFHHENESYWVEFPDLIGCQTFGDSLPETMGFAQQALAAYLLTLLEDGTPLPAPSSPSGIGTDDPDAFVSLVTCEIHNEDTRAVKKTLTVPAWLNEKASSMGVNFSQVLQDALLRKIHATGASPARAPQNHA